MTNKYATPGWRRRQVIWQHNGLRGRAISFRSLIHAIKHSPSTTAAAKASAMNIEFHLDRLIERLETRDDLAINCLVGFFPKPKR